MTAYVKKLRGATLVTSQKGTRGPEKVNTHSLASNQKSPRSGTLCRTIPLDSSKSNAVYKWVDKICRKKKKC